ncbi:MAG: putative porin [Bacteroidales bacterium]|nr:putative porin [Bacteroidales bacterium]
MAKKLVFVIIILISNILGFSQNPTQDTIAPRNVIVSPTQPIDSTFVTYNAYQFDSIFLTSSKVVDTLTFHASNHEVLENGNAIYSTLSNTGMAHKSMRFDYVHQAGFDMTLPAFSAMMQNENTMVAYQSVLPYSELRYVMTSGDKEQHLNVKFGRQFSPRLFISFAFNTDFSPGIFKNSKTLNNYFWVNTYYFTKNNRYGISAYWYRNKLEMEENGGIVNDEDYSSHTESDNSVISVNLSSATNFVVSSGIGFQQYFNLLPQKTVTVKKETTPDENDTIPLLALTDSLLIDTLLMDSIQNYNSQEVVQEQKVRKFTLGRICHSFNYLNNKLYYNESSPSVAFYQPYDTLLNLTKSTDTTLVRAIQNTLKWNSLGYQKYNDNIPFYVYAGVTHGFYKIKHFDYLEDETVLSRNYNQLSVNGGIIVNLFKSTRITGQGELVTLGYQIGDFDIKGQWKQFLGTSSKNFGQAVFDVELKRQSANWFEENYHSNHFRWENNFKAATYLTFNLKYNYKRYCIGVKQTSIANFIYFGTDARPAQYEEMFSIREAYLSFYQSLWRFEFEGFASLQKSSNEDVIHLPLLQGSLKMGYSQPVFHKAATLYPSITVRYFTKYYADAYMPATRTFYLQNEVQIGNFPFIDLALAIKVKKAHIYVAYSNMFLLTGNYNSFIAPHYPMRDSRLFIGINWRLFN